MDSDSRISLRTPRRTNAMKGHKLSNKKPGTMQTSWASPVILSPRNSKAKKNLSASARMARPHTVVGCSRESSQKGFFKAPSNIAMHPESRLESMISLGRGSNLRSNVKQYPESMDKSWSSSIQVSQARDAPALETKLSKNMTIDVEPRKSLKQSNDCEFLSKKSASIMSSLTNARPHTTTGCSRSASQFGVMKMDNSSIRSERSSYDINSNPCFKETYEEHKAGENRPRTSNSYLSHHESNGTPFDEPFAFSTVNKRPSTVPANLSSTKRLQRVKSYTSPVFNWDLSSTELPQQSAHDNGKIKYPDNDNGALPQRPTVVKSMDHGFGPDLNDRSPSISTDFKVNNGIMDSLVTEMPKPPVAPSIVPPFTPSEPSNQLRKQIEAALRMYPRNTWGPVTKWGYQEDLVPEQLHEHAKGPYTVDKEKLEKQRLESRKFGHRRNWVKFQNITNYWEPHEARQSVGHIDKNEQHLKDSEKMLHAERDQRIAKTKKTVEARRDRGKWREFKRLEARESEHIDKVESDKRIREDPRAFKHNNSGVIYNIVNLEYPNNYEGDLLRFEDAKIRWHQSMRALRIQSKQSGARLYNVLSWKAKNPCCVPPPKPKPPIPPNPDLNPSPRKPAIPIPQNMLHLKEVCVDIPVGCTNDFATNW